MTKPLKLNDFIPKHLTVTNPDRKLFHILDEDDCYALWAAYSAGRPLLIRGKPGTGKSQLAQAIAEHLGWAFVSEVIRGNTELSDLHWHFDAIGRLGEAQTGCIGSENNSENPVQARLDPLNFLSPGAFWWAYDWKTAQDQYKRCQTHLRPAPAPPDNTHQCGQTWEAGSGGVVLLLDEIDKAEPDLPNGLLETLGHYQFTVPYINHIDSKQASSGVKNPIRAGNSDLLVIITTNEERELPSAFVRRCFVHTLKMEASAEKIDDIEGVEKRYQWLIDRGRLHFADAIDDKVYLAAAQLLWRDRTAHSNTRYPPGLAEYIDLLNALQHVNKDEQPQRLSDISRYALQKELEG